MDPISTQKRTSRRRSKTPREEFEERFKRTLARIPVGTFNAVICASILTLGIVGLCRRKPEELTASIAVFSFGLAGIGWYAWNLFTAQQRKNASQRSHRSSKK